MGSHPLKNLKNNIFPWLCKENPKNPAKGNRNCQNKKAGFFGQTQKGGMNNEKG